MLREREGFVFVCRVSACESWVFVHSLRESEGGWWELLGSETVSRAATVSELAWCTQI